MKHEILAFRHMSLVAILFCVTLGCGEKPKGQPSSATIVTMNPAAGPSGVKMLYKADLKRLTDYFPGYAKRPTSHVAGSWIPTHTVYIDYPRGVSVRISLSAEVDGGLWSCGDGDLPIEGDFSKFIAAIEQN